MKNPFDVIEARLSNIETLLLDLLHKPKEQQSPTESDHWLQQGKKKTLAEIATEAEAYTKNKRGHHV